MPARLCRRSGRQRHVLADGKPHQRDLLPPGHDDFLSQAAKLRIMTVFELGSGNVDGTLMVGHHEGNEIAIHVAGRIAHLAHVQAHLADGQFIVDYELELGSIADRGGNAVRPGLILRKNNRTHRQDRYRYRQRYEPVASGRVQRSHVDLHHNTSRGGRPRFA